MVKRIKVKGLNVKFVLRHRFERLTPFDPTFNKWELGVWFRKLKIVGKKDFTKPNKWGDSLVNSYMIGVELLICKFWIEIHRNGMEF